MKVHWRPQWTWVAQCAFRRPWADIDDLRLLPAWIRRRGSGLCVCDPHRAYFDPWQLKRIDRSLDRFYGMPELFLHAAIVRIPHRLSAGRCGRSSLCDNVAHCDGSHHGGAQVGEGH